MLRRKIICACSVQTSLFPIYNWLNSGCKPTGRGLTVPNRWNRWPTLPSLHLCAQDIPRILPAMKASLCFPQQQIWEWQKKSTKRRALNPQCVCVQLVGSRAASRTPTCLRNRDTVSRQMAYSFTVAPVSSEMSLACPLPGHSEHS